MTAEDAARVASSHACLAGNGFWYSKRSLGGIEKQKELENKRERLLKNLEKANKGREQSKSRIRRGLLSDEEVDEQLRMSN